MTIHRRQFGSQLLGALGAAAVVATSDAAATDRDAPPASAPTDSSMPARSNPIAVSTYSFWRFRDDSKLSIEKCIDEAARMGFDGVEILEMQMDDEEPGRLQKLKRQAFLNGMCLCGFSTHQTFLTSDEHLRQL